MNTWSQSRQRIDVSICPSLRCNMDCPFCYVRRGDFRELDLPRLDALFEKYDIRDIDLYGGEITLLDSRYVDSLLLKLHGYEDRLSVVTNGLILNNFWKDVFRRTHVCFSLDRRRRFQDIVKKNILEYDRLGRGYSIISIDIDFIEYDFLRRLDNLLSISIKPYSAPVGGPKYKSYFLEIYEYLYENDREMFGKLEKTRPGRDDVEHYFMMPDGKLYDVQYDGNNQEYFEEISKCVQIEHPKCLACRHFGRCFNEHYRGYNPTLDDKCLGRSEVMDFLAQHAQSGCLRR